MNVPSALRLPSCAEGQSIKASGAAWSCDAGEAKNVIVVAKAGGDFTTITAALASILTTGSGAPSATNPFLIMIGPGVYNETVSLRNFVDLQGAGPGVTTIESTASATTPVKEAATVFASSTGLVNTRISNLSIVNRASTNVGIGVGLFGTSTSEITLDNVTVVSLNGGARNLGLYIRASSPQIRNTTIRAFSGSESAALMIDSAGAPTIRDSTLQASTATTVTTVLLSGTSSSSSRANLTIVNTLMDANGSSSANVAGLRSTLTGTSNTCVARVDNSRITTPASITSATFPSVNWSGTCTLRIGTTHLEGGPVVGNSVNQVRCVFTYDRDYNALSSCPRPIG
jgi:hypothetical protein